MTLQYGFYKAQLGGTPFVQKKLITHHDETQYHLHISLSAPNNPLWDCAINIGTDDRNDLLRYRMVTNFSHPVCDTLLAAMQGYNDLTGKHSLPALDFLRSDILTAGNGTGNWQNSDVMNDGVLTLSTTFEPVATLEAALAKAAADENACVYAFGRTYTQGGAGIHDIHMNQGSTGSHFQNIGNDSNDHNDVWQDGAVLINYSDGTWAAYFTAFTQQVVPTDDMGNPEQGSAHEINDSDPGTSDGPVAG